MDLKKQGSKSSGKSRLTNTVKKSSPFVGRTSRNGATFDGLQAKKLVVFVDESTLFPVDFPARTSQPLARVPVSAANAPGFGKRCSESFAKYDPDTFLWKTYQHSLAGGLEPFSETWPRSGTTVNGTAFRLPPSAPLIREIESGLWRTPEAGDSANRTLARNSRMEPKLSGQAQLYPSGKLPTSKADQREDLLRWPTPRATEWKDARPSHASRAKGKLYEGLSGAVKMFPTPRAREGNAGTGAKGIAHNLKKGYLDGLIQTEDPTGGQLNPAWVEWLMGLPSGWTDLNCLETAKSFRLSNTSAAKSSSSTNKENK